MALPTSGQITWDMIRYEFGGPYPINISEYYRGGPRVPNTPANANVPTAGAISANSFRGASASTPFAVTVTPAHLTRNTSQSGQSVLTGNFTITASGGTGNYTYTTVWLIAAPGLSLFDVNTNIPGVQGVASPITTRTGSVRIIVSDGANTIIIDRQVTFTWGQI